jgi:hypothetical protein
MIPSALADALEDFIWLLDELGEDMWEPVANPLQSTWFDR